MQGGRMIFTDNCGLAISCSQALPAFLLIQESGF